MMARFALGALPFYITELQGKVDVDLDPEDLSKLFQLPMYQMVNMNADTILNTMSPFGSNDDAEIILDKEGIWSEFPDQQKWQ